MGNLVYKDPPDVILCLGMMELAKAHLFKGVMNPPIITTPLPALAKENLLKDKEITMFQFREGI